MIEYQNRKAYYLGLNGYRSKYYAAHKTEILRKSRMYLKIGKVAVLLFKQGKLTENSILYDLCKKV